MKLVLSAVPIIISATAPAHATAGMFCATGDPASVEISLVIARVVGGPLISAGLIDNGVTVPTERAQWWLDGKELRLVLIDPNAEREEVMVRARNRGDVYKGKLTRNGRTRRVTCEESG